MTAFFHQLLQNSLSGALLILGILLFRRVTGNLSKLYVRLLWLVAFVILVFPPVTLGSLYTVRDLVSETENAFFRKEAGEGKGPEAASISGTTPEGEAEETFPGSELQGELPEGIRGRGEGTRTQPDRLETDFAETLGILWFLGAAALTLISLAKWLQLKKEMKTAVRICKDVWSTEQIATPFVMPGLPSRIYIPRALEKESSQLEDILKHERRHIANRDPWMKCFALLVLILHWFNPLVWLAFRLMSQDMEMYCDECVLRGKSMEEKKHYAQTLLDFACKSRGFSPALHFGKSSTKSRIRHVLYTKRPHAVISLLLLLLISGCGISFLTTKEEMPEQPAAEIPGEELLPENFSAQGDAGLEEENTEGEEEEEHWTDKLIVGIGHEGMEPGFDEEELHIMGETEHFILYGRHEGEEMVVRTPDCLVYAPVPLISNYEVEPLILEQDFDDDGNAELAIITYVLHGTGISIRSLFMTDKALDSSWNIYHYREKEYLEELTSHFNTEYTENGVRLMFDGRATGAAEKVDQEELDNGYAYYAGSQIDFRFVEEKIFLRAELAGYSDVNHTGNYPGHQLEACLHYKGEGKWEFTYISYVVAGITELLENAVPLYLTGQTEEVNAYCTAPGVTLSDFEEPSREVTVLSIALTREELDGDETEAYVCVRQDGSDSLDYLTVPIKRVPSDYGEDRWQISGEILMEK
ncbi:MAG: M56 family metallopeptidase [Lachnospiraceae bacterium]|nr:M56 family metallopeptidase [Lachnospiraceae bacterium]